MSSELGRGIRLIAVLWMACSLSAFAVAQQPIPPAGPVQPPAAQPPEQKEDRQRPRRLPAPVEVGGGDLLSKDGVQLTATYYPGTKGKDSVAMILLHDLKGNRRDLAELAEMLQAEGHAVLVPDLRGHGDSTTVTTPGGTTTISADDLSRRDFPRIVRDDLETCKSFLMKENNAGNLNIERLGILGLGMGATVATDWARLDWSWPVYPGLKQGQDVKALILISPEWSIPGVVLQAALAHPAVSRQLAVYIIVGRNNSRAFGDAQRIHNMLKRARGRGEPENLVFYGIPTSLQGRELLGAEGRVLERSIVRFVEDQLAKPAFTWQERNRRKQ